ncbi:MAG: transporter, hydrophobe/amphiphile efflux family, partial [Caulobacteraceae bacterium]|nr:transporter, hydrophobe/amphiphile efflux family [Caulobacteraceae bacterium]
MNFSRFFISRPRFAAVLSLIIFIAGLVALPNLPISEYPEVVPPTVVVRTIYPGADPAVIAETVAAPIEQAVNGVEGMLYQSSQAASDGTMTLTITFALGTDGDKAQTLVQNRVAQVLSRLPQEVQRAGVTTTKASPALIMVVHLTSPNKRYDKLYLANYAQLHVKDALARTYGVGDVQMFGTGAYSMRVWLDPQKLASRGMTAGDVVTALREQNVQVAAGQVGAPPAPGQASFQVAINTQGRLTNEEQFGDVIIRAGAKGEISHLRDVARVELGSDGYALRSLLDNEDAVALPIFQRPGSNALQMAADVRKTMDGLAKDFPEGVKYHIVYDTTGFVHESIDAVIHTLIEAIILVVIVVVLFLQSWRASIIPLIAVPVSLVGSFAALLMLGFGLNALTLFGLVLAIGIVVDDAIVVVENVERNIALGLSPTEATRKAM